MINETKRILLIGSGLWFFGEGMFGPFLAVFSQRIGGDILETSWAWAIYLFVMGFLMIIVGLFSDKVNVNKGHLMIGGYALNTVFTFGYLFVSTPAALFLIQAGLGVAAAFATPTWDALYTRNVSHRDAGAVWGIADGMHHIVTAMAVIVGGVMITHISFTVLFAIMAAIQAIATVYQAKIFYPVVCNKSNAAKTSATSCSTGRMSSRLSS